MIPIATPFSPRTQRCMWQPQLRQSGAGSDAMIPSIPTKPVGLCPGTSHPRNINISNREDCLCTNHARNRKDGLSRRRSRLGCCRSAGWGSGREGGVHYDIESRYVASQASPSAAAPPSDSRSRPPPVVANGCRAHRRDWREADPHIEHAASIPNLACSREGEGGTPSDSRRACSMPTAHYWRAEGRAPMASRSGSCQSCMERRSCALSHALSTVPVVQLARCMLHTLLGSLPSPPVISRLETRSSWQSSSGPMQKQGLGPM